jgi:predicted acetyltransferase
VPLEIRPVRRDELDALLLADQRGFGGRPPRPDAASSWTEGELDRTRVAFDGDEIVGISRNYSFELTMPGGAFVPAAAVSWVSVLPTHRRRGVLTAMMQALHTDARAHGEPVAILTASEGAIYGRFGYGIATWRLGLSAERARVAFRGLAGGRVRLLSRAEVEKLLPPLYDRARAARAGMVSRPDFWWPEVFSEHLGGPDKAFFVAVHSGDDGLDDGFVAYEITGEWEGGLPDRRLVVRDLQAIDASARAALWQYVFGIDLVAVVSATNLPIDDPLRHLVVDSRRIRVDYVNDGVWLAPLEPSRLLAARTYAVEGALVLEVHAPDGVASTLALEGGPDGARCTRSSAPPDIVCSRAALGACVLGGNRWSEFADAGLVHGDREALLRADAMFLTVPAAAMLSHF